MARSRAFTSTTQQHFPCDRRTIGRKTRAPRRCPNARARCANTSTARARTFDFRSHPKARISSSASGNRSRAFPMARRSRMSELAQRAGAPKARRARRARRRAAIRITIVVPCHRVVGSDGSLTGYAGGLAAQDEAARDRGRAAGLARLRPADLARLVTLAALWGASYLFMRYAVPYFGPATLIELRVLIAGVALAGVPRDERRLRRMVAVLARRTSSWDPSGSALPFVLIAQALTAIDASTAAILNALSPLFASIVAALWIRDPLTPAEARGHRDVPRGHGRARRLDAVADVGRELFAAALLGGGHGALRLHIVFSKVKLKGASPLGTSAGTLLFAAASARAGGAVRATAPSARGNSRDRVARGAGPRDLLHDDRVHPLLPPHRGCGAGEGDHGDAARADLRDGLGHRLPRRAPHARAASPVASSSSPAAR